MPDHHEVLIEAHDLERAYHAGDSVVYALRGIDLTIYKGEYISLMGPSGSGKTTFFNMIGALDFPTGGRILIGGRNLKELSPGQLAYLRCVNMGDIFQNFNLLPDRGKAYAPELAVAWPPASARSRSTAWRLRSPPRA